LKGARQMPMANTHGLTHAGIGYHNCGALARRDHGFTSL
jgi:hypothetical protein